METLAPVALAKRELIVRAVSDGRRIGLQFGNGVDEVGKRIKRDGAVWFAPRRLWVVPHDDMSRVGARLRSQFADLRSTLDLDSVTRSLGACAHDSDYFSQLLDVQIFPLARMGGHAVSFAYDAPTVEAMRSLRGRFHKAAAAWELRAPQEVILEALFERAGVRSEFVFIHEHPVVLEDLVSAAPSEVPITVPAASPERFAGLGGGEADEEKGGRFLTVEVDAMARLQVDEALLSSEAERAGLRDYQVPGVRHLLSRTSALLADDMGLGKSRQAVVASRLAAGSRRVLVVCPASLRINWEREIRAVYPDARVGMVGEDRLATLHGCDWVVANYERLGGLVRETALSFEVVTIDEAHFLKEVDAGRTRNAFVLAARIPRCFLLTGTPLLSREVELHTLLRMSGHALGRLELKAFRKQYAGSTESRTALAEQLRDWMLRRRKDVLTELGAKHRQVRFVSPAEGRDAYDQVMADMSLMVMPKIVKLRQTLEAMKLDFIIETIQGLGEGDKVIVFAEYMVSVTSIREACEDAGIGVVSLVGSDPGAKRQKAIDAFQRDPAVRVFIGTTSAAGVGITLTAANYVLFASLPWTPALMRQAEDRAYRLGQKRDVYVIVPLVPKTIDEQIHQLLASKTELEQDVVEAVKSELTIG